jgi:dTDP-glucose 4,6-dehydratase
MRTILVTGGAGFIGSNFVRMVLEEHPDIRVVNLDKLTYAGNLENLAGYKDHPNHIFVRGDICDAAMVSGIVDKYQVDAIINFAAESHVDRSLVEPGIFIETNVNGTLTLLKIALDKKMERFVQISTDEVYGALGPEGKFGKQGRRRHAGPGLRPQLEPSLQHHPMLQQLRTVSVSGEDDSFDDQQRPQ